MSKISLKPNASGTGVFSLEAPNSNTDRTLTLPDEAGTVLTNVSDISAANLTGDVAAERITGALNATGSAPVYACRAWVSFSGGQSESFGLIQGGNISSVVDNGKGDYTVNFSTNMPDADYAITTGLRPDNNHSDTVNIYYPNAPTSSSLRLITKNNGDNIADMRTIFVAVHR